MRDRILANEHVSRNRDQSIPIIIQCETEDPRQNELVRRLPWHLYNFFNELSYAEFALFTQYIAPVPALNAPIKVLAIFGSFHDGLQLERDREELERLRQLGQKLLYC